MANDNANSSDIVKSTILKTGTTSPNGIKGGGIFTVECRDTNGELKWVSKTPNLVVNVGLADMNTRYFKGSGYTAAWYVGIYGAASTNNPASTDTMASHAGWTEVTAYSASTRPVATFGAATTADPSLIANSASPAQFSINTSANVGGAFLTTGDLKGGTSGTLFSAADFAAPGDRVVQSGDTLSVTYTFSLDAV
jgi:hypothetical protein